MAKRKNKIENVVRLQIPAGQANPSPPVGPALGQVGLNIMEFCNAFNAKTADAEPGILIPVVISVYSNKTYTFITKTPPASTLLKKAAGIAKGSGEPNIEKVGKINQKQLKEIAELKAPDLNAFEIKEAMKIIAGTARSMGLEIEGQDNE